MPGRRVISRRVFNPLLKSGRARGGETVIMVENVRNYYDILVRIEPRRSLSPLQSGLTMQ
jgi:membrane-bound lytic murein transglycosylase F